MVVRAPKAKARVRKKRIYLSPRNVKVRKVQKGYFLLLGKYRGRDSGTGSVGELRFPSAEKLFWILDHVWVSWQHSQYPQQFLPR